MMTDSPLPTVDLMDVRLHALTEQQCIGHIMQALDGGHGGWVVTPNLDIMRRCGTDRTFHELIRDADLVVADGMPLIWASRLQRTPLPERVAGSTLIGTLSQAAAEHGRRVFLLGGDEGTAEAAAEVLSERCPGLEIAGTHCPAFGFENDPEAMAELVQKVTEARPDIVFVALGSPKQERLIVQLRDRLPAAWWLGIGISFSFLAGQVRRAPLWMQRAGLEWLHRLCQEPRRLARRYLIDGIPFASRLLTISAWRGLTGSPKRSRRTVPANR